MTERKEILNLLKATYELDITTRGKIREEWDAELMVEALNLLAEEYKRLREKYEEPGSDFFDLHMAALLLHKWIEIHRLENILKEPRAKKLFPEMNPKIKDDLVRIIVDYYHFIAKSMEEDEEATA